MSKQPLARRSRHDRARRPLDQDAVHAVLQPRNGILKLGLRSIVITGEQWLATDPDDDR